MLKKIAEILINTGNIEFLKKAKSFENDVFQTKTLNLRNLDLKPINIITIADILQQETGNTIKSISFSYNNLIGDTGVIAIMNSLPESICEIGLVDCGIGDEGGAKILNWIKKTTHLKMICIEQNNFSNQLKIEFNTFKKNNPKIIVVI